MSDCLICRVVSGAEASWVVHESAETVAFFPRSPEVRGHTLVAPRQHVAGWRELPAGLVGPLFLSAQAVSVLLGERLGCDDVNVLFAGGPAAQQSVPHFHLHVLPRWVGDGVDAWPRLPGSGADLDELLAQVRGGDVAG